MCESTKKIELVATDFNYEVVVTEPPLPTMADSGGGGYIPSWNGNPLEFEDYKIGCERLVDGTKDGDQHLLGPRLAARLTGQA